MRIMVNMEMDRETKVNTHQVSYPITPVVHKFVNSVTLYAVSKACQPFPSSIDTPVGPSRAYSRTNIMSMMTTATWVQ